MSKTDNFICHIITKDIKPEISWEAPENTVKESQHGDIIRLTLCDISASSREIEWNPNTSMVILRRTSLWSKPFYFYLRKGELIISDSLRQIVRILPIQPQICRQALDTYLALEFFPAPITPFREINKVGVEETCLLNLDTGSKKWITNPLPERLSNDFEQAVEDVSQSLQEVMDSHTQQYPEKLVLLCSGGLDSTIMAHLMHGKGRAIVLSYVNSWKDEVLRARQTAEYAQLPLQEIQLPEFNVEQFYKYTGFLDEPLGGTCSYPLSHLAQAIQPESLIIGGHGSGALSLMNFKHRHLGDCLNYSTSDTLEERFCSSVTYMDTEMRKRLIECGGNIQDPVKAMLEREIPFQKDIFHALHAIIRRQLVIAEETTQIWSIFGSFGHKPIMPILEKTVYTTMDRYQEFVLRDDQYERKLLNEIARRNCPGYTSQPRQLGYGLPLGLSSYPNEFNMIEIVDTFSNGPISKKGMDWLLNSCKNVSKGEEKFYWLRRLWSAVLLNAWLEQNTGE